MLVLECCRSLANTGVLLPCWGEAFNRMWCVYLTYSTPLYHAPRRSCALSSRRSRMFCNRVTMSGRFDIKVQVQYGMDNHLKNEVISFLFQFSVVMMMCRVVCRTLIQSSAMTDRRQQQKELTQRKRAWQQEQESSVSSAFTMSLQCIVSRLVDSGLDHWRRVHD